MVIYNYDAMTGEYTGQTEAAASPLEPGVYLVPAHATTIAPPAAKTGCARIWGGEAWTQVEDHRGETVYATATGAAQKITALGPLPAGVTTVAPGEHQTWDAATSAWVTDAAAVNAARKAEIQAQLDTLDASSARPLRAILAAQAAGKTAVAADLTKLADLEAQAVALRTELAGLEA